MFRKFFRPTMKLPPVIASLAAASLALTANAAVPAPAPAPTPAPAIDETFDFGVSQPASSAAFTGDGSGLTDLNADAIIGGLTTNIVVSTPGGGSATLLFINGILRAVQ